MAVEYCDAEDDFDAPEGPDDAAKDGLRKPHLKMLHMSLGRDDTEM